MQCCVLRVCDWSPSLEAWPPLGPPLTLRQAAPRLHSTRTVTAGTVALRLCTVHGRPSHQNLVGKHQLSTLPSAFRGVCISDRKECKYVLTVLSFHSIFTLVLFGYGRFKSIVGSVCNVTYLEYWFR